MNAAHLHLLINHVPILATFFSIGILVWGMVAKSEAIKKVAMAGFLVAGLFVIVAFQSGESAEDIVEDYPAVTHDAIEEHEEAAAVAQWLTILLGIGGAAGLYMVQKNTKGVQNFLWVMLVFGAVTAGYLSYTAYEGGLIRHPEIENSSADAASSQDPGAEQGEDDEQEEDDDDD